MIFPDSFNTIDHALTGDFKDKGSKFLAYAFPVSSEDEVKEHLKALKKEHYAAAHICWAYVIGVAEKEEKSSDDREPAGSAGKPILRSILEKKLCNVMVAVVRYFGGKLLGVPGLIQAYAEAARNALLLENLAEKRVFHVYFQACSFDQQHEIIRIGKQNSVKFYPDVQDSLPGITFEIAPGILDKMKNALQLFGFETPYEIRVIFIK